jgi:uncharacterized metal-binding protein
MVYYSEGETRIPTKESPTSGTISNIIYFFIGVVILIFLVGILAAVMCVVKSFLVQLHNTSPPRQAAIPVELEEFINKD